MCSRAGGAASCRSGFGSGCGSGVSGHSRTAIRPTLALALALTLNLDPRQATSYRRVSGRDWADMYGDADEALDGMGGDSAGMGAFTPVEISEDYNLPAETVRTRLAPSQSQSPSQSPSPSPRPRPSPRQSQIQS